MRIAAAIVAFAGLALAPAHAAIVDVIVTGQVVYNDISDTPLGDVAPGAEVLMAFAVDSNNWVDGPGDHTRSYAIDPLSFALRFDSLVQVGLKNPYPNGWTPYFTLADGVANNDGFFMRTSTGMEGIALSQEPYQVRLDLEYDGDTLDSLDILDARGVYDLDGLIDYAFDIWKLTPSAVVMGINFEAMTISTRARETPVPAAVWLLGSAILGLAGLRRR